MYFVDYCAHYENHNNANIWAYLILAPFSVLSVILIISTIILLVYKLVQVYKMSCNSDHHKATMLTLFSIFITVIATIFTQFAAPWNKKTDDIILFILARGLYSIDVLTNFIFCVYL